MSRTEDRLADALHARAGLLRVESLPPLADPVPRRRRGRWLAPAGAAAGVALAVGVAFALTSLGRAPLASSTHGAGPARPPHLGWTPSATLPGRASRPPRYYAVDEATTRIRIRSTATGAITAAVPDPPGLAPGMQLEGMAAGGGGNYIAAYGAGDLGPSQARRTQLYSFHVTAAGRVRGLSQVRGGLLDGVTPGGYTPAAAISISPDGSKVALVVYGTAGRSRGKGTTPELAEIVVIDLRTGARQTWQGGLRRQGYEFGIPSISWAPNDRWLVFLGEWCSVPAEGGFCGAGSHHAQVRTLDVGTRTGALTQGSVLMSESRAYPFIAQAVLTPGGGSITAVVLIGQSPGPARLPRDLRVVRVPLTGGRPTLLFAGRLGDRMGVSLSTDSSGRYWVLAGHSNGWIGGGRLHPLPPQHGFAVTDAW